MRTDTIQSQTTSGGAESASAPMLPSSVGKKGTVLQKIKASLGTGGYLLLCALIPMVLMYLLYLARGIHPFGDGSVLVLDLTGQYVYFYEALRDILHGDASLFYSFSRNLGGEFMGIFDYYVASPFAWIVALFPEGRMLEALLTLFLMKTGLLGFTMGFYLHKHSVSPNKIVIIVFSILYAMSAYAIIQQHNSMWIDAVIWLPILSYAIERLIQRGRFRLYVIMLSLTICANFYIGYMTCIYTAAYFFYWYFAHNQNNENNPRGEEKHFLKSLGRIAIWSAVAVCISAVFILTAKYSLGFGKSDFSTPKWDITQKFNLFEFFYKFLPASYDTVRPKGLPFVYCGILTVMLVPAFFMSKKINNREKVAAAIFVLFFIVSFTVSTIDLIWHGFQKPNWLNYRYSYMLIFFLIVLAYRAFENITFTSRKSLLATTAFIGLFVIIIQELGDTLVKNNEYITVDPWATVGLSLACLFAYFILICLYGRVKKATEAVAIVLCFFVCVEVFLSALSDMEEFNKDVSYSGYAKYNDFLDTFQPIADRIAENDSGFYRTEKTYHKKMNDAFALRTKGLSCSTSTLNEETIKYLASMGYTSKSHWSKYIGGNPVSDSLLGVKYLITDKDNTAYYGDPIYYNEDFEYDEDFKPVNSPDVYLNKYALSLIYGVSDSWAYFDTTAYDSPFDRLNAMITAMLGETELVEVFVPTVQEGEPTLVNCKYSTADSGKHHAYKVTDTGSDASVTYQYTVPTDTELYVYFPSGYPRETEISVNGTKKGGFDGSTDSTYRCIKSIGSFSSPDLTMKVTIKNSSNNLYYKLKSDNGDRYYTSYIYYIDVDLWKDVMTRLGEVQYQIDESSVDDHLTGTVTTAKANQLMATTIAYDEGWKILVDGEPVEMTKSCDALISFTIEKPGEHSLELKYRPTCLTLGGTCSIVSLIIFVCIASAYVFLKKVPVLRGILSVPGEDLPGQTPAEAAVPVSAGDIGAPFKDSDGNDAEKPGKSKKQKAEKNNRS